MISILSKEVTLTRALGAEVCQPLSGKDFKSSFSLVRDQQNTLSHPGWTTRTALLWCGCMDCMNNEGGLPCQLTWLAWRIWEGQVWEENQNKPGAFKTCGVRKLVNSLLFSIATPHPPLLAAFTQHTPQKVAAWYNKSAYSPTSTVCNSQFHIWKVINSSQALHQVHQNETYE